MTNQQHPITPPPGLVQQWIQEATGPDYEQRIATQAARWGADQELEACCEWLVKNDWKGVSKILRAARRPEPPSLKAGAIAVLDELDGLLELPAGHYNTILRALEKLDDSL